MPEPTKQAPAPTDGKGFLTFMFNVVKAYGAANAQRRANKYKMIKQSLWGMVIALLILFLGLALFADEHTLVQFMWIELFGGVATFAAAPVFLKRAENSRIAVPAAGGLIAIALALGAFFAADISAELDLPDFFSHGIWPHLLLELAVAMALLVGIDQLLKGTLRYLDKRREEFTQSAKSWMALDLEKLYKAAKAQGIDLEGANATPPAG